MLLTPVMLHYKPQTFWKVSHGQLYRRHVHMDKTKCSCTHPEDSTWVMITICVQFEKEKNFIQPEPECYHGEVDEVCAGLITHSCLHFTNTAAFLFLQ